MTSDFVPCQPHTAAYVTRTIMSEVYNRTVPVEARRTLTVPPMWTEDNAVEFTRALVECDSEARRAIFEHARDVDVVIDLITILPDVDLDPEWLAVRQCEYAVLRACLDMGKPVCLDLETANLGHLAIIHTHSSTPHAEAARIETLIDEKKTDLNLLRAFKLQASKPQVGKSRTGLAPMPTAEAMLHGAMLGSTAVLVLVMIWGAFLSDMGWSKPCPEPAPCPDWYGAITKTFFPGQNDTAVQACFVLFGFGLAVTLFERMVQAVYDCLRCLCVRNARALTAQPN